MNIPNFIEAKVVDENGYLTPIWRQILIQIISQLQTNVSDNGYILPQVAAVDIPDLNSLVGNLIYDSTNDLFKVNLNGTYKTVTTS